jgi:hypothetical protein
MPRIAKEKISRGAFSCSDEKFNQNPGACKRLILI